MKTVTQAFKDDLIQTSVPLRRRVYYKRRFWVESSKSYTWETDWTELSLDKIVSISSINWQLDTQTLSEFKVSNVTITLENLHNQWKADNPYGYFGGDDESPRGYESFWMKFKVAAGVNFVDDEDEELLTLFTGLATEYTQDSQSGHMQVTLNGLEALLMNADAERVSTEVVEENAGTGNGVNKDFTTAHNGVGLIELVSVTGATKKAGVDFTISQLNDSTLPGKISFIAAPANLSVIRISYRYWHTTQLFETLVSNLCTEAGIEVADQLISPVIFPNKIINKHLFDTQAEWVSGTKTAIDTATLVDSIKIDFGDASLARTSTTYGTATTGWTTYGSTQVVSNNYDTTAEFNAGTKTAIDTVRTANALKVDFADLANSAAASTLNNGISGGFSLSGNVNSGSFQGSGWFTSGGGLEARAYSGSPANGSWTGLAGFSSNRAYGTWQTTFNMNGYPAGATSSFGFAFMMQGFDSSFASIGSWTSGYMVVVSCNTLSSSVSLRRHGAAFGDITVIGSPFAISTSGGGVDHTLKVVRYPSGLIAVYFDGVNTHLVTDTVYTASNYTGYTVVLAHGPNTTPQQGIINFTGGAFYIPNATITSSWFSAALDLTTTPSSFQSFAKTDAPNGATLSYFSRTSADGLSWDSWVAITGSAIASTLRRYLQVRVDFLTSQVTAQDPAATSLFPGANLVSDWTAPSSNLTYTPATASSSGWVYRSLFKGAGRWDCSVKESSTAHDKTIWWHFMFQSVGVLGTNNFFNGYSLKLTWSGSDGNLKFIRNDSATIGTEVELGSFSVARSSAVSHALSVIRAPSGRFLIYYDAALAFDVTDTTFTTGNFTGFHVDSSNAETVRFGDSTLYVPANSITAVWESTAIDEGGTPDAWSPIEYSQTLNGGSTAFFTKSSADNVTYDAYVAVPPNLVIQSTLRRYIKIKTTLTADTTANQDPTMSAFGSGSVTTSTRITLANFAGKTCYAAIQSLAQFANYEWGFTPEEDFFFRSKIVSNTPVMFLSQKDFLMKLKSAVNGFSRIYSSVRATYGSYQADVSDDALNYLGPIARFARQRLDIDGGDILVSADADVATGVAGAFFNYYKSARRKFKIDAKFVPQLDLSDTINVSFLDNYPSKLWSLGDTTVFLGQTDINLFGDPEQTLSDTLCKVIGMRIDTEAWQTELDLEEILT